MRELLTSPKVEEPKSPQSCIRCGQNAIYKGKLCEKCYSAMNKVEIEKCWICEIELEQKTFLIIPKISICDGKKEEIFPLCPECAKVMSKLHHTIKRLIR